MSKQVEVNMVSTTNIGRGYGVSIITYDKGDSKYDVVLTQDDMIVHNLNTGCIGLGSAQYWSKYDVTQLTRVIYLVDLASLVGMALKQEAGDSTMDMLTDWLHDIVKSHGDGDMGDAIRAIVGNEMSIAF